MLIYIGAFCHPRHDNVASMKFIVKCLYENGVLLRPQQLMLQPTFVGNFTFEDLNELRHGRLLRKARLRNTQETDDQCDIVPALFDAEIVSVDDNQIIVRGYSYRFDTAPTQGFRCRQCWSLRSYAER